MGRSWLSVLFAVGCYHPTLQQNVPCTSGGECPGEQMCIADRCVDSGTQLDAPGTFDAPIEDNHLDAHRDAPPDAARPAIMFESERDVEVPAASFVSVIAIPHPACPTGAVMLGAIAMGQSGAAALPTITPPPGWALVRRLDHALDTTLAVYVHIAAAVEPTQHTWGFTTSVEGVSWIACYANVDAADPIDDDNGVVSGANLLAYPYPSVSPDVANTMLVGFVAGHGSSVTTWSPPTGTTERLDASNATTRSATLIDRLDPGTGATAVVPATASQVQDFALLEVIALRPAF